MNKQQRIKELDELIAKAQAEREQLAKDKALWVPDDTHWGIGDEGRLFYDNVCGKERAKFGHAAPDREKAEQLRDFFTELVPKHPVPEVGQEYWVFDSEFEEAMQYQWEGSYMGKMSYNLGLTWDHEPTPEEIERKRKALAFDSSWRWV